MILKLNKCWMKNDGGLGGKENQHHEQILTHTYFMALAAFNYLDLRRGRELDL